MSTDTGRSKPRRKNTPNARSRGRKRLQLQPFRGRYPVLPPVGQSWPVYPLPAGQNFIIPTPAYPTPQMIPAYNPQTAMPFNVLQSQQPPYCTVTVPTSMMCYYAPTCMPMCEWGETTEVLAEQTSGEAIEQSTENMLPNIQQTIMYYDPLVLLKICEEVSYEIVEAVIKEMAREVVTALIDEMVKSYLGHAHLVSASSLERPRPQLEEIRPRTNPTHVVASQGRQSAQLSKKYRHKERKQLLQPLTPQLEKKRDAGLSAVEKYPVSEHRSKYFTKEVAEYICLIILDELLFQQFLEVAIVGNVHKPAEALAGGILNELLFEGFLKQIFEKQASSKHCHVLNQL